MAKLRPQITQETLKQRIIQGAVVLAAVLAVAVGVLIILRVKSRDASLKREILADWKSGANMSAFEKSGAALEEKPLDSFLLTVHGFVSYQLAVSQINNADTVFYLDNAVWSLRKALVAKPGKRGAVLYTLGKAYYEKGPGYADLAIKYLNEAQEAGFAADDIPEYLGLAYQSVRDYESSIEAFSEALSPDEGENSGRLLFAMARSYAGAENWDKARDYLRRCIEATGDSGEALRAKLLLAKTESKSGDADAAEALYGEIIEEAPVSTQAAVVAEANYELSEIYQARGDAIGARAALRRAYRADAGFVPEK